MDGDSCADEGQLNLYSIVQQQKALLVLAQEQIQIVELEQRLIQAEAARSGCLANYKERQSAKGDQSCGTIRSHCSRRRRTTLLPSWRRRMPSSMSLRLVVCPVSQAFPDVNRRDRLLKQTLLSHINAQPSSSPTSSLP